MALDINAAQMPVPYAERFLADVDRETRLETFRDLEREEARIRLAKWRAYLAICQLDGASEHAVSICRSLVASAEESCLKLGVEV